jgi:hypothetical protein
LFGLESAAEPEDVFGGNQEAVPLKKSRKPFELKRGKRVLKRILMSWRSFFEDGLENQRGRKQLILISG